MFLSRRWMNKGYSRPPVSTDFCIQGFNQTLIKNFQKKNSIPFKSYTTCSNYTSQFHSSLITNPSPTSTVPTNINYKRYRYSIIPIAHTNYYITILWSLLRVLILPLQIAPKLLESSLMVHVLVACLMTRRVSYIIYTHNTRPNLKHLKKFMTGIKIM